MKTLTRFYLAFFILWLAVPGFALESVALVDQTEISIVKSLGNQTDPAPRNKILLSLASHYLNKNQPQQSLVVLRGSKTMDPSIEAGERFRILEAKAFEKSGETEKALALIQPLKSDEALFKAAYLLETSGQSFAAVSKLQELLRTQPQSPLILPSRLALANSYLTLREFDQAGQQLAALEGGNLPNDLDPFRIYFLGAHAFETQDFGKAQDSFAHVPSNSSSELKASSELMQGVSALRKGDFQTGEEKLSSLLQSSDKNIVFQSTLELVKYFFSSSHPEKAVSVCNTALPPLANDPRKYDLLLLRGISLQKSNQMGQALKDFQDVISFGPAATSSKALVLMGTALWMDKQYAQLTNDYAQTVQLAPQKNEVCNLVIGEAHLALGNNVQAEQIFRQILSKNLSPALSSKVTEGLVASLVAQQKYGEGEKQLDELLVRFGDDRAVVRFGLMAQAHLLWNKGDYKKASESYSKYSEMFPKDEEAPQAFYMSGRCSEKMEQPTEAFKSWDHLRKTYPDSPYVYKTLVRSAALAQRIGKKDLAESYYEAMAKVGDSQMVEVAALQMGFNRLENNQSEESLQTFNQFVEHYPLSNHLSQAVTGIQQSYEQIAKKQPQRLPQLAQQYAANPYSGEAHYWMGIEKFDQGAADQALPYFQKVLTDYPRSPSFHSALFYKGQSEYQMKNYSAALVTLGQFVKASSDKDLILLAQLQRANALVNTKFLEEACVILEGISKDAPYSDYAANALLRWAQVEGMKEDYVQQTRVYESFLKDFPQHPRVPEVYWQLGHLKRRAGAYQLAMNYYEKVVPVEGIVSQKELDEAIKSLQKIASTQKEARP